MEVGRISQPPHRLRWGHFAFRVCAQDNQRFALGGAAVSPDGHEQRHLVRRKKLACLPDPVSKALRPQVLAPDRFRTRPGGLSRQSFQNRTPVVGNQPGDHVQIGRVRANRELPPHPKGANRSASACGTPAARPILVIAFFRCRIRDAPESWPAPKEHMEVSNLALAEPDDTLAYGGEFPVKGGRPTWMRPCLPDINALIRFALPEARTLPKRRARRGRPSPGKESEACHD